MWRLSGSVMSASGWEGMKFHSVRLAYVAQAGSSRCADISRKGLEIEGGSLCYLDVRDIFV